MSSWRDLDDYKLQTEIDRRSGVVLHRSHRANRTLGRQRIAIEERWAPQDPPLGSGSFGIVRLEQKLDTNGEAQCRAVKELRKIDMQRMEIDFRKELLALTKFSRLKFVQSEAFVTFLGWFDDDQHVYIAMEYFKYGTLDLHITPSLRETDGRNIAHQLLEGVRIMHEEHFAHRDLKPQNIFVVQNSPHWWVKIGDFGISKRVATGSTVLHTRVGSPLYLAPEVFHYVPVPNEESEAYTNAVDIWSLACVVFEMLALRPPFMKWPKELVPFCHGGPFPEEHLTARDISAHGIDFVKSILVPYPAQRPTAEAIMDYKWFRVDLPSDLATDVPSADGSNIAHDQNLDGGNSSQAQESSQTHLQPLTQPLTHANEQESIASDTQSLSHGPVLSESAASTRTSTPNDSAIFITQAVESVGSSSSYYYAPHELEDMGFDTTTAKLLQTSKASGAMAHTSQRDVEAATTVVLRQRKGESARSDPEKDTTSRVTIPRPDLGHAKGKDGCRACGGLFYGTNYVCATCDAGLSGLCSSCVDNGEHCSDESHWLLKCDSGVGSETKISKSLWALQPIPDRKANRVGPRAQPWGTCAPSQREWTVQFKPSVRALESKPEEMSAYPTIIWRPRSQAESVPKDYCAQCGCQFPCDKPPQRHIWENHEPDHAIGPGAVISLPGAAPLTEAWYAEPSAEEIKIHRQRIQKMEDEMTLVFNQKVAEKENHMKGLEEELYARHIEIKNQLNRERSDMEQKKKARMELAERKARLKEHSEPEKKRWPWNR